MSKKPAIGLIVNPVAGMGGRVGLKGTDGDAYLRALRRGAVPLSGARTALCLAELAALKNSFTLYTGSGPMGEEAALQAGLEPVVLGRSVKSGQTTPRDTANLADEMLSKGVGLILFAGGDGTARDICDAIGEKAPALGIPAGVKIHSAVFASSPKAAGLIASHVLERGLEKISEKTAEVMDIDEDAYRRGELKARLYGYLRIPCERGGIQNLKSGSPASEAAAQAAIGHFAAEIILSKPETLFLVGAGTTTRAVTEALGVKGTLLGIDACLGGKIIAADVTEKEILALLIQHPDAVIVVTPIGGQGFVFGRGNQQFSPEVIRRVGRENILILSTPDKLNALAGAPLLVDTGEEKLDIELEGYFRILSGYQKQTMYRVEQG